MSETAYMNGKARRLWMTMKIRAGQSSGELSLILTLLTWTIWRAPTNASKWRMGFNSAFEGLIFHPRVRK